MDTRTIGVIVLGTLAILLVMMAGCTGTEPAQPSSPTIQATPMPMAHTVETKTGTAADAQTVMDANNRFAFDLFSQLAADPENTGQNIFFSPFSISSALALTYEGARGTTADEIRSVFHFPSDNTVLRQGYTGLNAGINDGDAAYILRTANALWAEKTYPFLPDYLKTAERYYGANTTNLDFIEQPEESRLTINKWVEDRTDTKIRDLLPAGTIDSLTKLVITNAVYFKGNWVMQFDKNKTSEAGFRTADGSTVSIPMMQRTDKDAVYLYAGNEDLQLLSMLYENKGGRQLSMVVLLPHSDDLSTIGPSLDGGNITALMRSASKRQVMVYFPKFKLETKYNLPETLAVMGMPTAFSDNANFSGMDGTNVLYIKDIIHQAFIDINEEGSEAAAATAVVMEQKAAVPSDSVPVFLADHPFMFFIRDDETGAILFMGRVTNPAVL